MNLKSLTVVLLLASACFVTSTSDDASVDAGADADVETSSTKTCWTANAQYAVTFTLLSGDCPNIDDRVSYQWLNGDGTLNIPPNCTDHGTHSACTSWIDERCNGWAGEEVLSGELDWSPGGQTAEGKLTFTAFDLQDGGVNCSSVYDTNYTLQWQAAGD